MSDLISVCEPFFLVMKKYLMVSLKLVGFVLPENISPPSRRVSADCGDKHGIAVCNSTYCCPLLNLKRNGGLFFLLK